MEPLVIVTWRDASFHFDDDLPDDYLVRTVGFLVSESDVYVTVAQERLPDDRHRAITMIPACCVIELDHLEFAPPVTSAARNTSGLEAIPA